MYTLLYRKKIGRVSCVFFTVCLLLLIALVDCINRNLNKILRKLIIYLPFSIICLWKCINWTFKLRNLHACIKIFIFARSNTLDIHTSVVCAKNIQNFSKNYAQFKKKFLTFSSLLSIWQRLLVLNYILILITYKQVCKFFNKK